MFSDTTHPTSMPTPIDTPKPTNTPTPISGAACLIGKWQVEGLSGYVASLAVQGWVWKTKRTPPNDLRSHGGYMVNAGHSAVRSAEESRLLTCNAVDRCRESSLAALVQNDILV